MKIETKEEAKKLIISAIKDEPQLVDEFLKLVDIELTEEIPTLAVRASEDKISLLINKEFVEKYCETEENLHFLFYHELYHIYFGHLFLDINCDNSVLLNAVFDALINSFLVKKLKDYKYFSILFKTYKNDKIPSCILRPPEGYNSQNPTIPEKLPSIYKWAIEKLYYSKESVSYNELVEILKNEEIFEDLLILKILLGQHPINLPGINLPGLKSPNNSKNPNNQSNSQIGNLLDKLFKRIFGNNANAPLSRQGGSGCSPQSSSCLSTEVTISTPRKEEVQLIRKAIHRLLLDGKTPTSKFLLRKVNYDTKTVVPDLNEKTYIIRQESDLDVVFYDTTSKTPSLDKPEVYCNVYVDVSGSMSEYYSELYSALSPFAKQNLIRIFLWSTFVSPVKPQDFLKGKLITSTGTEISCVLEHILQNKVKKALVLTDGIFSRPSERLIKQILDKKIIIDVILSGNLSRSLYNLKGFTRQIYRLS